MVTCSASETPCSWELTENYWVYYPPRLVLRSLYSLRCFGESRNRSLTFWHWKSNPDQPIGRNFSGNPCSIAVSVNLSLVIQNWGSKEWFWCACGKCRRREKSPDEFLEKINAITGCINLSRKGEITKSAILFVTEVQQPFIVMALQKHKAQFMRNGHHRIFSDESPIKV